MAIVDSDGSVGWSWENGTGAHDMHMLENGNVVVPTGPNALAEVTAQKEIVWRWKSTPTTGRGDKIEIHGFERLGNGLTMIAETVNRRIMEVDQAGEIQFGIGLRVDNPDSHRATRLVRSTRDGTYLVAHDKDGAIR